MPSKRRSSRRCSGTSASSSWPRIPRPGLARAFDGRRVRRTPISEAAFTGMAVGAAVVGMRPVVWWRNATFGFVAFDQVMNQAAKLRYMFGGQRTILVVLRATSGGGSRMAAQHSQSPYSIYAHVAGLKTILSLMPRLMPRARRSRPSETIVPNDSFEPGGLPNPGRSVHRRRCHRAVRGGRHSAGRSCMSTIRRPRLHGRARPGSRGEARRRGSRRGDRPSHARPA